MTKSEIVGKIQDVTGYTLKESAELFETTLEIIKASLERGETVKLTRFGNFEVREKRARRGRDPQTGKELTITPRRILSFRPSAMLKQAVNAPLTTMQVETLYD